MQAWRVFRRLLTHTTELLKADTPSFADHFFGSESVAVQVLSKAHCSPPTGRVRPGAMSLTSSSSAKALESPFSHKDLYGVEHPSAARGRRKSKHKRRKSSKSSAKGLGSGRSLSGGFSGLSRRKGKDAKDPKPRVASTVSAGSLASRSSLKERSCACRQTVSPISLSSLRDTSLAAVEPDSPNALRHRGRGSKGGPLLGSKSSGLLNGSWGKQEGDVSKGQRVGIPSSLSAHTAVGKSTPRVSSGGKGASRLSLSESEERLRVDVVNSAVNIRFNRMATNLRLPPHLCVPRRAFGNPASGGGGRGGRGGEFGRGGGNTDALTVSDVASGLSRRRYQRVIVMSGAGISTPSGIPDFR